MQLAEPVPLGERGVERELGVEFARSGVRVNDVNTLVDRFFEARKLMGQMPGLGRAATGGMQRRSGKNARNNKKGKKGRQTGRGPTQARTPAGLPPGALGGAREVDREHGGLLGLAQEQGRASGPYQGLGRAATEQPRAGD